MRWQVVRIHFRRCRVVRRLRNRTSVLAQAFYEPVLSYHLMSESTISRIRLRAPGSSTDRDQFPARFLIGSLTMRTCSASATTKLYTAPALISRSVSAHAAFATRLGIGALKVAPERRACPHEWSRTCHN